MSLLPRLTLAFATATLIAGCATPSHHAHKDKVAASTAAVPAPAPAAPPAPKALVIAHRGASALRPEHTLASYAKAIEDGADVIEPDLVMTRDGVLVARHENDITGTTNVAEVAGVRRPQAHQGHRRGTPDRLVHRGLHAGRAEDAARPRAAFPKLRPLNAKLNDQFEIPTFDEILRLASQAALKRGRPVGIYPELKHPSYFRGIGLPLEEKLAAALQGNAYARRRRSSSSRSKWARCAR